MPDLTDAADPPADRPAALLADRPAAPPADLPADLSADLSADLPADLPADPPAEGPAAGEVAPAPDGLPVLPFPDQAAFEAWLAQHADSSRGVWLRLAKKDSGIASLTYAEAVESLLCFGWIDGQRGSDTGPWYRQRVTPRRPTSLWSQVNVQAVGRLQEQGRMRPGGLREVERAQADGRWDRAYAPPSTIEVPDDLRAALDAVPAAAAAFAGLDGTNRYAVLHRVTTAKRVATRERRVAEFVAMLAEGRTPYPPRRAQE